MCLNKQPNVDQAQVAVVPEVQAVSWQNFVQTL